MTTPLYNGAPGDASVGADFFALMATPYGVVKEGVDWVAAWNVGNFPVVEAVDDNVEIDNV